MNICANCGKFGFDRLDPNGDFCKCPVPNWLAQGPKKPAMPPVVNVTPSRPLPVVVEVPREMAHLPLDVAAESLGVIKRKKPISHRKHRRRKKGASVESQSLLSVICALIEGHGYGGLAWMSRKLKMPMSVLRRRLLTESGGFDAATIRALELVSVLKAQNWNGETAVDEDAKRIDQFVTRNHQVGEEKFTTWEIAE